MCRLVIHGPGRQLHVGVPADVLIGDLLPALLHHFGGGLADAGLAHAGWILQRLGDAPLDEDLTVAGLGLRDGDRLHLRPRSDQIPPIHFDDLADGIATGVRSRAGVWRPKMIRWAALGAFTTLAAVGVPVLAMSATHAAAAACAAGLAICGLAGAFALTRAGGDHAFGIVAATAGMRTRRWPRLARRGSDRRRPRRFRGTCGRGVSGGARHGGAGCAARPGPAVLRASSPPRPVPATGSGIAAFIPNQHRRAAAVGRGRNLVTKLVR
jgi:hypothetical protein